ncbi:uncharacterized protein LOC126469978 [Schistocerca serialis cubense]|uniref:uncharacterized protein LOC126469977 n=1 Tax=Schistocerca serialis cubense TaxID=2023355 RepID=UPI00214EB7EA|nr:uncharacterized protein LOC126469977 [Schistocerca serialis cubense]XP_049953380.1 uncharacterized protein LOC126469977 [Schistocerca serialis cubense]XP_049953381.1 uncharacterized protein LOC126469977 [Schistocerca serialis cubense]XP_049953382.1 uncharacterized protein LOC126469978 [Schistocerca serialis cubense]
MVQNDAIKSDTLINIINIKVLDISGPIAEQSARWIATHRGPGLVTGWGGRFSPPRDWVLCCPHHHFMPTVDVLVAQCGIALNKTCSWQSNFSTGNSRPLMPYAHFHFQCWIYFECTQ